VKVQVRRSLSSKVPAQLIDGDLEMGVISYDPEDARLVAQIIYTDHLCFVVPPGHHLAGRGTVSIAELGQETFIAHNVLSPYREVVVREFKRRRVPLIMDVEMPTVESIRRMVQMREGAAFLPHMCVAQEIAQGTLCECARRGTERRTQDSSRVSREAGLEPCRASVSRHGGEGCQQPGGVHNWRRQG
jgi:DNA-binding transcriptional LysR family regulator